MVWCCATMCYCIKCFIYLKDKSPLSTGKQGGKREGGKFFADPFKRNNVFPAKYMTLNGLNLFIFL